MSFNPEDKKALKKFAERRHPEYEATLPHWNFLESCYEGGREWFDEHIFPYFKEGEGEFNDRVKRAYRFNHSREIVDLVNKYIFKGKIERNIEDASEAVKRFWEAATRNNMNIDQFMRRVSLRSSTFGRIWVVVDNNNSKKAPKTVAEEKELGIRTYAYIVNPQDVWDLSYDSEGRLNWIMLHELERDDEDPFTSSGAGISMIKLWTRTHWYRFKITQKKNNIDVELDDDNEHGLGVVPVFSVDHVDSDEPYVSPSLIGDIAYLDRAVANYLSNLDAIIQDQTFSQLAIPAQNLMPGEEGHNKVLEMGTKRVFTYDGENGNQPFYLSPDPKQAEIIIVAIKQIINEIYHSVGMAGERTKQDNAAGIDNSSGVAKAYDFERVNALLVSKADSLDRCEEKLCELVNLWSGDWNGEADLVKYPDTFDVRGLYDEFEIAAQLSLVEAPDLVRREQMKAMVVKLFPRASKKLKAEIEKELEAWPPAPPEPISNTSPLGEALNDQNPDGGDDQQTAA